MLLKHKFENQNTADPIEFINNTVREKYSELNQNEQDTLTKTTIAIYDDLTHRRCSQYHESADSLARHAYLIAGITHYLYSQDDYFVRISQPMLNGFRYHGKLPLMIITRDLSAAYEIAESYLQWLSKNLVNHGLINQPVTSVVHMSRMNYICDVKLERRIRAISGNNKYAAELAVLKKLQSGSPDMRRAGSLSSFASKQINVDHQCSRQCGKYYTCRYRQTINQLNLEDIMIHICSHKYYMNEIIRRSKGYKPLLPAHAAVIIEQAECLDHNQGLSNKQIELDLTSLSKVSQTIRRRGSKSSEAIELADSIEQVKSLLESCLSGSCRQQNRSATFLIPEAVFGQISDFLTRLKFYLKRAYKLDSQYEYLRVMRLISDLHTSFTENQPCELHAARRNDGSWSLIGIDRSNNLDFLQEIRKMYLPCLLISSADKKKGCSDA
jgi:hypothetical protein